MPAEEDRYLRPGEAARFLGITPRWLGSLRRRGDGPPSVMLPAGGQPRYLFSALRAWAEGRHGPPADAPRTEGAAGAAG